MKKTQRILKITGITALVLLVLYFAGALYFSAFTFPRTTVNGEARGFQSLEKFFLKNPSDVSYTFQGREGETLTISESDIRFSYHLQSNPPVQPSSWKWPSEILKRHDYTLEYAKEYDADALNQKIQDAGFQPEGEMPEDAEIVISSAGAEIQPEKQGTRINGEALTARILDVFTKDETNVDVSDLYYLPQVLSTDEKLLAEKDHLNAVLSNTITYDFVDRQYVLGAEQLKEMIKRQDDGSYAVQESLLAEWVRTMARKTDTYGTERKFRTTEVGTVTVPPGIYGWQMNVKKTTAELMKLLEKGENQQATPVYNIKGVERASDDIGDTYIELDLSRQHLWGYKDGTLVIESGVRTGQVNHINETPRGVNKIWSHEKDRYLDGDSNNGTPYHSHVDFWMPINYGGVGLHDADWVKEFGGNHYLYNGSNGCINLPKDVAKKIFETFPNGTPVITYESSTNYSPVENTF
ncbi:MAG: peptidoglycan binding domain-containing protein [Peptoniphilaceae bacterium]|nr:peptidoglycan binding domain-containing protein [Peptoniphilaceae bacterium]MDY3076406.1 peptidoglycan binding domain-containing protein [Peptoniphilaceae bacterium]